MELGDISLQWEKFGRRSHHPMFRSSEPLRERVTLTVDFWPWWNFYVRNRVHGSSSSTQFRTVGWEFALGLRPWPWLEVEYHHHSQHNLDQSPVPRHFPVEDSGVVRVFLHRGR